MAETETIDAVIEKGLAYLRQRIRIEAAYLFGSQLTGETHGYSDIDLAVFSPDVDNMDFFQRVRVQSDLAPRMRLPLGTPPLFFSGPSQRPAHQFRGLHCCPREAPSLGWHFE